MRRRITDSCRPALIVVLVATAVGCSLEVRVVKDRCNDPGDCLNGYTCVVGHCQLVMIDDAQSSGSDVGASHRDSGVGERSSSSMRDLGRDDQDDPPSVEVDGGGPIEPLWDASWPDQDTPGDSDVADGDRPVDGDSPPDASLADAGASDLATADGGFDWRDAVAYYVLIDRFRNGDSSNDQRENAELAVDFQGGDLQGVFDQLQNGYFDRLGINVLWLSSPMDTVRGTYAASDGHAVTGYHGFWPDDIQQVEARYGTLALLQQVVTEAHARGIKVVMDYVVNHVHQNSPVYAAHGSWFNTLQYQGVDCLCGLGCSWDGAEGLRCWFASYLPDFDYTQKYARDHVADNVLWWVRQTGIDGLRLDAANHVDPRVLVDIRARLDAAFPTKPVFLLGQTFSGDKTLIRSLIGSDKLDGQLDVPLRAQLVDAILRRQSNFYVLDAFLAANDGYYGPTAVMASFIGSVDLPRAIHLAEDTPLFGQWDSGTFRAWTNQPTQPTDSKPYERLAVAFTALLTLPGAPMIYYGDEIGLAGAGDPDNRRFMPWSGLSVEQSGLRSHLEKLTAIRFANSALRHGSWRPLFVSSDVYAYERKDGANRIVVLLNRADSAKVVNISGSFMDLLTHQPIAGSTLTIPARSSMVLK